MARTAATMAEIEIPPQADQLEGILHPRKNERLFGQDAALSEMAEALRSGRMHHGWMLTGPEGIGKATLAYRVARALFAGGGEVPVDATQVPLATSMDSVSSRQVAALSHPGLMVLRRQWDPKRKKFQTAVSVDEVRRLRGFLGLSAGDGAWRVVIVDRADEMNTNAANALLKSLEEPPARCLFLLIASEPGRLPATIHSRCRRLQLTRLGEENLRSAVLHVAKASDLAWPDDVDWTTLHRLSQGSVARAIVLGGEDGLALYRDLMKVMELLPKMDRPFVHGLAESLSGVAQENRFNLFLDLLQDALGRMVRYAASGPAGPQNIVVDEQAVADRVISPGRLAQWSELWETLTRERAEARLLNLDRQNLILDMFQRIEALARQAA